MRYGIPTGYKPKLNKKQTQQYAFLFADRLVGNLIKEFKGLVVDCPAAVDAYSGLQPAAFGRPIAFDTLHSAKIHRVVTEPDGFLTNTVNTYQPDFGHCLLVKGSFIDRDAKVSNVSSVCTQTVMVEGRVVATDAIDWRAFLRAQAKRALDVIELTVAQLVHLNKGTLASFKMRDLTEEEIRKKFWSQQASAAIELVVQKHGLVFIDSPRLLFEDQDRNYSLVSVNPSKSGWCCFYASACESALTFFEVGIRPDANYLKHLENLLRDKNSYGGEFVDRLLAGEIVPTFFIRFNVSHLLMAILSKAHVAEVVASVWSDDFLRHCRAIGLEIM